MGLSSVTPNLFGSQGAVLMTITGTGFDPETAYAVFIGLNGDTTDPRCYGGRGYGSEIYPVSATEMQAVCPLLTVTGDLDLTVQDLNTQLTETLADAVTVIERAWLGKAYSMRACFPAWYRIGNRRVAEEGLL